ncbi:MAG: hypothetical protein ACI3XA_04560 [Clostridia bacterium]
MDFEKKLKLRLYMAIGYVIVGVCLIGMCFTDVFTNDFFSSFGLVLFVIGIAKIRKYRLITKDEETIRRQKIAETDERNIAILHKAKSVAFGVYSCISAVMVIVFEIMGKDEIAIILALMLCVLVFVYWLTYWIYQKKG